VASKPIPGSTHFSFRTPDIDQSKIKAIGRIRAFDRLLPICSILPFWCRFDRWILQLCIRRGALIACSHEELLKLGQCAMPSRILSLNYLYSSARHLPKQEGGFGCSVSEHCLLIILLGQGRCNSGHRRSDFGIVHIHIRPTVDNFISPLLCRKKRH